MALHPGSPVPVADFVEIQRLVSRYSDAVVRRDGSTWADCWSDDASWDLGGGRSLDGKEMIVKVWYAAMGGMAAVVQQAHGGEVWLGESADHAIGRWAITERFRTTAGESALLLASYDDEYRRIGGRWLFSRRFLDVHYRGAADLSADFANTRSGLEASGRTPDV